MQVIKIHVIWIPKDKEKERQEKKKEVMVDNFQILMKIVNSDTRSSTKSKQSKDKESYTKISYNQIVEHQQ